MNEENYLQQSQYTQTPFTVSPLSSTKSVVLRIYTFCTLLACAANSRHFVLSHLVHCSLRVTLHTVTLHSSTFFAVPQRRNDSLSTPSLALYMPLLPVLEHSSRLCRPWTSVQVLCLFLEWSDSVENTSAGVTSET